MKVVKNKLAPPFQMAEFDILYGTGIDAIGDLLDLAVTQGVLEKRGAYFALDGETIAQGRERGRELLLNDPALLDRIRQRVAVSKAATATPAAEARAAETAEASAA